MFQKTGEASSASNVCKRIAYSWDTLVCPLGPLFPAPLWRRVLVNHKTTAASRAPTLVPKVCRSQHCASSMPFWRSCFACVSSFPLRCAFPSKLMVKGTNRPRVVRLGGAVHGSNRDFSSLRALTAEPRNGRLDAIHRGPQPPFGTRPLLGPPMCVVRSAGRRNWSP